MDGTQLNMGTQMNTAPVEKRKGISGSTIKIIAVVTMLIDHIAATILTRQLMTTGFMNAMGSGNVSGVMNWLAEHGLLYSVYTGMRLIGRLGFPIFCFLLVEGFQKTRNVKKYALRLAAFALISEIPFDLAFKGKFFMGYQNVYFTLLLGLLALCGIDYLGRHELPRPLKLLFNVSGVLAPGVYLAAMTYGTLKREPMLLVLVGVIGAVVTGVALLIYRAVRGGSRTQDFCAELTVLMFFMCLAEVMMTDYSGMGVLTIGVMYYFRKKKVISMLAGCIVLTVMSISEITSFFTLIPVALYNGSRGLKMKYFFYAFYPVHLLLLYLVSVWMGLGGVPMP